MSGVESIPFCRDEMGQLGVNTPNSLTRNTKNTSKLLESKRNFNISNDKGDREGSNQASNEADAFVELKNEHRANLFIDIE
ncbi:hypothetical protein Tco_1174397 [Tanacetum coccineum]